MLLLHADYCQDFSLLHVSILGIIVSACKFAVGWHACCLKDGSMKGLHSHASRFILAASRTGETYSHKRIPSPRTGMRLMATRKCSDYAHPLIRPQCQTRSKRVPGPRPGSQVDTHLISGAGGSIDCRMTPKGQDLTILPQAHHQLM